MIGLTQDLIDRLASAKEAPCLSLYQATHRHHPDNQQDPIRYRNLLKVLDASLRQNYSAAETQRLLAPFEALAEDTEFWNHTLDGLAVLGGVGVFEALRLPKSVPELTVVADSFHIKPLMRFLQSVDRYQVLGLSFEKVQLFEGNRHVLDELDLVPEFPRSLEDALGKERKEPHLTVASYGGVGAESHPMHHGHSGKPDRVNVEAEAFFRVVDRAVYEHYSKPSGLPLVLAALPEHHHLFHQISQNPHLLTENVRYHPDSQPADKFRALTWQAVEPLFEARLATLLTEFEEARATGLGSDNLTQVAEAATAGRVASMLIDAGRQIAGRLNDTTGEVELDNLCDPHVDDLLDDLSVLVVSKGGTVKVIPAERMPSRTGLAAIYRY